MSVVLHTRRKHKALERALKRRFSSLPNFFRFRVQSTFADTYNSIVVPAGVTKPLLADLETDFDSEITKEENNQTFRETSGNMHVENNLLVEGDVTSKGDINMFSDERLKKNIEPISNALEKVLQLRGVTFEKIDDLDDPDRRHAGVIAQEVEKVLPEVVNIDNQGMKTVAYGNLIALLIEAIKELANK